MSIFKTTALTLIISLSLLVGLPVMGEDNGQAEQEQSESQGAFWGALIGALVGAFIGDDNQEQAINAAIGAAIGAGAGLLLDNTLDQGKDGKQAESESERADRVIREMRATNQQLSQELTAYQQKIDRLVKSQGKASYRDLRKQKQILDQRTADAKQALAQLINELKISQQLYQDYQRGNNSTELLQWQVRVAKLEQEKYELELKIEDFTALKSRL